MDAGSRWQRSEEVRLAGAAAIVLAGVLVLLAGAQAGGGRSARTKPPPTARHAPVVMIVFDELPLVSLLDGRGRIDATRYPHFASLARGSDWFANATTVSDRTTYAVPAILSGRYPKRGAWQDYCFHRQNLFTLLHRHGYAVRAVEPSTALWPPYSCHPVRRKKRAQQLLFSERRPGLLLRWARAIRPQRRPTVSFQHTFLPHLPWQYLPSGRTYGGKARVGGPHWAQGLKTHGDADPYLARLAQQRHLLQVGYVDRLLGRILAQLRKSGSYDRALIVLTADHGIAFHQEPGANRREVTRSNVGEIGPVPLFMKLPGQRRGRVVRRPVESVDILPTIAQIVQSPMARGADGRSALARPGRARRRLTLYKRSWRALRLSNRAIRRSRGRALSHRLRLFGSGHSSLYRLWRNQLLLGTPVSRYRVRRNRRLRARFEAKRWLRSVDPSSGVVPALVSGNLTGGPAGEREVALALNGTFVATAKTYRLVGRPQEFFALMAPEQAFHAGANRVELFAISRSGRSVRLSLLGSVG